MTAEYEWDRMISSIIYGRVRSAYRLGITIDDLRSGGRLSAVEAERTWRPDGGRSLSSWIFMHVCWGVGAMLRDAAHQFADALAEEDHESDFDLDSVYLIREAIGYLRADLADSDWELIWLHCAEGRTSAEISAECGIGHAAVRKRIERIRKRAVTSFSGRDIEGLGA